MYKKKTGKHEEWKCKCRENHLDFPGGSDGKESACNAEDLGSIPGLGRSPGEGNAKPTSVFLPGEFHGQRSLMGPSS